VKNLDIFNSTSAISNDKKLNVTYFLYTAYKNDSIVVDFGDNSTTVINLNLSNIIIFNVLFSYLTFIFSRFTKCIFNSS
jgi:hypothetical protein